MHTTTKHRQFCCKGVPHSLAVNDHVADVIATTRINSNYYILVTTVIYILCDWILLLFCDNNNNTRVEKVLFNLCISHRQQ